MAKGRDLIIAAAAHLSLVQGKEQFSRTEILDEMKAAPSFYKQTYRNNFSAYLDGLVKEDRLRLVGKKLYALSSNEKKVLEPRLAQQ